ncbi:hypothetical protein ACIQ6U_13465 [Lysinibacillus fusiformis]|uniref:hypothetical protein n=1 Tax=Lysinibacillus fusiformis TaxID=28031 RepID=UPI00380EADF7
MKKVFVTSLLLSTVIFSECQSDQKEEQVSKEAYSPTHMDATLIGASDNQEVKLYEKGDGEKRPINGKVKTLTGTTLVIQNRATSVLHRYDEGWQRRSCYHHSNWQRNGLDNYDIHIVNQDLQEIKVPHYEEIVAQHIETNVVKKDHETLTITGRALGKEYHVDYHVDPELEFQQDELGFGEITIYYVENQKIKLTLAASVFPIYVADFHITYKFDQIEVAPIQQ